MTDASQTATVPPGFVPYAADDPFLARVARVHERRAAALTLGFPVEPHHCNPLGFVHGGMLSALIDVALMETVVAAAGGERVYATIGLDLSFVSPGRAGEWIEARGSVERLTRDLAFVSGQVTSGERVCLTAKAIYKKLRPA